ncbi:RDD family protein [Candidatus Saccharibacteria bacterium oral taxon 488]|nr:RDD family protein [Candidatus Saccharibacteria bacterium oral taxon 488]
MQQNNPIPFTARIKELCIDWLVISAYLLCLFAVSIACYFITLGGIPTFSELHSQLIATFASVLVVVVLFTYLDFKGGSIGKRAAGLEIYFTHRSFSRSLVRNSIKFFPWQIGHMAVIHGVYTEFDTMSIVLSIVSCTLLVIMFLMGTMRRDRRHLGDMLAGTQVQLAKHK